MVVGIIVITMKMDIHNEMMSIIKRSFLSKQFDKHPSQENLRLKEMAVSRTKKLRYELQNSFFPRCLAQMPWRCKKEVANHSPMLTLSL